MPGHLQRHPLERTYDDVQRSVTRLEHFLDIFGPMMHEAERIKTEEAIKHLEKVLAFIPKKYRKTYREWKKDADND